MLTVPQQPPVLSATGKLVVRCSWSFRRASSTGSLALQHADMGRMMFSTRTSEARRSSAATPQHTSPSVTTPTSLSFSVSSTTGVQPQPESRIACAACATVSFGVQHEAALIGFITSLQQLIVFPLSIILCLSINPDLGEMMFVVAKPRMSFKEVGPIKSDSTGSPELVSSILLFENQNKHGQ